MSDTREEANQELVAAGMQAGMEDALAASLSDSFAPPSIPISHKPATEVGTTQAAGAVASEAEEESTPVPGMDEFKSVFEAYNKEWKEEADIAREKAIKNRKYYEDLAESSAKKKKDEAAAKKRKEAEEKKEREGKERLRRELAGEIGQKGKGAAGNKTKSEGEKEGKMKEAWELVQGEKGMKDGSDTGKQAGQGVATDGRGVMDQDILAGQAVLAGKEKKHIQQTMYDPTTSTEPLPASMQASQPSPPAPQPSESQTLSRHSATSQAWTEISGSSSTPEDLSPGSGSGSSSAESASRGIRSTDISRGKGSLSNLPTTSSSSEHEKRPSHSLTPTHTQPPAQPPSLTLSLFSSPSSLSVTRLVAVLGINLVLPFINGVMLGFGEIFAREVVKVGGLVWRGEKSLFGWARGRGSWGGAEGGEARGGGRGVAGVGLSGSGGFP